MDILTSDPGIRVIENERDHEAALAKMATLMASDPPIGSDAERVLKTLAVLVREYESARYQIAPPDPVEAIKFRMEQEGLAARDLVPYLGSRSRVSEILARKRPLTLAMIRNLTRGLGIPAASLLNDRADSSVALQIDWKRVPFREMKSRGWIERVPSSASDAKRLLESWMEPVRGLNLAPQFRRHVRAARAFDQEALLVWTAQVAMKAMGHPLSGKFDQSWSIDFLKEAARISVFKNGPALLQEFLDQHGIALIVERPMSPWLDGAAMICSGVPTIALTLRHDRLDNFWFVVMHELVHLLKHAESEEASFYDDLDAEDQSDPKEIEADTLGGEALISSVEWQSSPASRLRSPDAVNHLARQLKIHPAIVAGRIRKTYGDYRVLSGLVGHGEVRKQFPEY